MSSKVNGTTIILTRGDSFYASVPLWADEDEEELYVPENGDSVRFAVKHAELLPDETDFADTNPVLTKSLTYDSVSGLWDLHLVPNDTKSLGFGDYVYDIQLTTAGGDDFTFVANAKLKLTPEVD